MIATDHLRQVAFESRYLDVCRPEPEVVRRSQADSQPRARFGMTVVGIKRPRQDFIYPRPETVIESGDLMIVCGQPPVVEQFAAQAR